MSIFDWPIRRNGYVEARDFIAGMSAFADKLADRFGGIDEEVDTLRAEVKKLRSELDTERRLRLSGRNK